MESPPVSEDEVLPFDSSKPFAGVVVCCTSIPPEHRTFIADRVKEFGGVHKYDLTPDVTHLVVGEYDTLKYRHVARERPDIKPMAAGWINAVRSHWVNDQDFDFRQLESEYRLKTFESSGGLPLSNVPEEKERQRLLICLTGFEEHDRHYIEETVTANGGNYMGDLSKKVTHLIVCNPEGKKYEAAKNWNISTVSIEWLDDSVKRGMILEETCYDPILPKEKRGKGAITRREIKRHSSTAKRPRDDADVVQQNGPRKLRKSASMRLMSQGNNLLDEIFNNKQPAPNVSRPALEQKSASVSALPSVSRPAPVAKSVMAAPAVPSNSTPGFEPTQPFGGVFTLCRFMIDGFPEKKHKIIHDCLTSHDGQIAASISDLASSAHPEAKDQRFLVVPQTSQPDTHPTIPEGVHIVTEFYIERCIHGRRLLHPNDHVLGKPFPRFPVAGFETLVIHSTGFKDEQLNQVEKTIVQLGAKYAEKFNSQSSLVICPSLKEVRTGKLDLAVRNKIPVVNADWLWQCISNGFLVPWDKHIFPEIQHRLSIDVDPDLEKQRQKLQRTRSEPARKEVQSDFRVPAARASIDKTAFSTETVPVPVANKPAPEASTAEMPRNVPRQEDAAADMSHYDTAPTHQVQDSLNGGPLKELGTNMLNKSPEMSAPKPAPRKTLSRHPTGGTIADSEGGDDSDAASIRGPDLGADKEPKVSATAQDERARRLKKEFDTIMENKPAPNDASNAHSISAPAAKPPRRKREILGRAPSNASVGSSASAESVATAVKPVRMDSATKSAPGSMGLLDEMLSGEVGQTEKDEEVARPPATQIGYDDPQAAKQRAEVMDRMTGKKKATVAQAKPTPEKAPKEHGADITSTAASRRPRRKGL